MMEVFSDNTRLRCLQAVPAVDLIGRRRICWDRSYSVPVGGDYTIISCANIIIHYP